MTEYHCMHTIGIIILQHVCDIHTCSACFCMPSYRKDSSVPCKHNEEGGFALGLVASAGSPLKATAAAKAIAKTIHTQPLLLASGLNPPI